MNENRTLVTEAKQVTEEMLEAARGFADFYRDTERIDAEDFIDRMDGISLADGTVLDLGNQWDTPAQRKLIREARAELRG